MILGIILIFVAAISKAIQDKVMFHFDLSVFRGLNRVFWDPNVSWKNKWKEGDKSKGEKFPLSSTALVMFTDAWHLFQFIFLNSLMVGSYLLGSSVTLPLFVCIAVGYKIIFEVVFSRILSKNK